MTTFSPLASLDPLNPTVQAAASSVSNAASSVSSSLSTAAQKFVFGGLTLSQVVIIIVGLLLIGAGLFSLRGTREIIVQAGKTAGKAAAAAA
jgi:predicted transporter